MKHFPQSAYAEVRTFYDRVTIQLEGSPKYGGDFSVEIEFTATRDRADGDAGEREIVAVRPFEHVRNEFGQSKGTVKYLDCPDWLAAIIKDCIDVDALDADWSE